MSFPMSLCTPLLITIKLYKSSHFRIFEPEASRYFHHEHSPPSQPCYHSCICCRCGKEAETILCIDKCDHLYPEHRLYLLHFQRHCPGLLCGQEEEDHLVWWPSCGWTFPRSFPGQATQGGNRGAAFPGQGGQVPPLLDHHHLHLHLHLLHHHPHHLQRPLHTHWCHPLWIDL